MFPIIRRSHVRKYDKYIGDIPLGICSKSMWGHSRGCKKRRTIGQVCLAGELGKIQHQKKRDKAAVPPSL